MGYIYKITNDINGKVYIGQTKHSIASRWKSHQYTASHSGKHGCTYLCNAINRYGADHFSIEEVEKCSNEILNDKERYWIQYYQSYREENGYNLTLGGDSGFWIDYNEVYSLWDDGLSVSEIQSKTGHSRTTLSKVLHEYKNYSCAESKQRQSYIASVYQYKPVIQYSQDGTYLNRFETPQDAISHLGVGIYGELIKKCRQPNRMYYGYQWRFEGDDPPGAFIKRKELYRPVIQFDTDGKEIARYDSITIASRETKTSYQGIQRCCKEKQNQSGGFIWRYAS